MRDEILQGRADDEGWLYAGLGGARSRVKFRPWAAWDLAVLDY